jgi:hypothetical protein
MAEAANDRNLRIICYDKTIGSRIKEVAIRASRGLSGCWGSRLSGTVIIKLCAG